jgi:lon-related putative ATP-dependent protease
MTALKQQLALSPAQLTSSLSSELLNDSVSSSAPYRFFGQDRAKEALEFGLSMDTIGFNVFAMGEAGTGRHTLVKQLLDEIAAKKETPPEWCYINNFDQSHAPFKLYLNPGDGKLLLARMNKFIDELLDLFPEVFDNPSYQRQKSAIDREFNHRYEQAIEKVEQIALEHNVMLYEEDGEVSFLPVVDGQPLDDKAFANLAKSDRDDFYQLLANLEHLLTEQLLELPLWKRASSDKLRQLKRDTAEQAIRPLIKELEHEFASNLGILKYLASVKNHVVDVVLELLVDNSNNENSEQRTDKDLRKLLVEQFLPNLLVEREPNQGAPIVYEQNPTYQNLFGYIDFASFKGNTYTSYRHIRAGALHRANGGYVILEADKLLMQPNVWSRLKLAMKTQQLSVENPYSELIQPGVYTLQPEKIPFNVKVILLGDADTYYTLQDYDREFSELFRVLADFERYLPKTDEHLTQYAQLIRHRAQQMGYPVITDDAILELVRYSLRRAEHQQKLSANIVQVNDLLDEAVYWWRKQAEDSTLTAQYIQQALQAKQRRTGRLSETWLAEIKERQLLISTQGEEIGKINGLTVLEIGDSVFGTPARISATVYAGSQGVTDIEREVELGKSIHSKGVLLLTGYLGNKYGQNFPVSISANIAIEQSYGHIDGDSASLAELCALISAISQIPIDQSLAMTGSVNQHGEVQSIGGVNEKIEGFFHLCRDTGLTGKQGVIIPQTNVVNLMLSHDVIAAVADGKFHIYAVSHIDQALALLMNMPAGEMNRLGRYPRKTIHGKTIEKLAYYAELLNGGED